MMGKLTINNKEVEIPEIVYEEYLKFLNNHTEHAAYLLKKAKAVLGKSYLSEQIDLMLSCDTEDELEILVLKNYSDGIQFVFQDEVLQSMSPSDNPFGKVSYTTDLYKVLGIFVDGKQVLVVE